MQSIRLYGDSIKAYEVVDREGRELPPFTAGAHIDFHLNDGCIRQYSLCNDPSELRHYVFAVQREPAGRGGSKAIFEQTRVGDTITISTPRNHFPLREEARRHLLLAGGIGITPMVAMIHRLCAQGADFILHYCTRSPARTAFLDELSPLAAARRVLFHHDGGDPRQGLDISDLLARREEGTHLYYCGPEGFMAAVRRASAQWPADVVHCEYFSLPADVSPAETRAGANDSAFQIKLARRGLVFDVPRDCSIVEALRRNGIEVETSCESGLCGTCRTAYLEGEPDHRDVVLDDEERRHDVLICCARSKTPILVLDL